jgi:formate hydrogenlyase transcriptional activator
MGSWACSADLETTYFSAEMFRLLGFPVGDAPPSAQAIGNVFAPGDWVRIRDLFDTSRRDKNAWDGEFRAILPDGSSRTIRIVGNPVPNASGDIVEFLCAAVEVTEQRQFRAVINAIPEPVWSARPDGVCDFLNQHWLDYTGCTAEQGAGWNWHAAIHPDDVQGLLEQWRAAVASGARADLETRIRRFDGEYRWFRVRCIPLRDESGNIVKWLGTNIDIEGRRRAGEALRSADIESALQKALDEIRRSETKLRRVIDTIPTLAWCNRADGPNEFLNKGWHEYTGLSPEDSHGWGWQVAFHPEDLPPLMKRWGELLISGEPGEIEARLRRHDGVYRWFLIRVAPYLDDAGKIVRWYGTSTDIEDRKWAEAASQALSSEMVLPRLIEKLLRIAVEHAGAGRGLLILFRGGEPRIDAEATAGPAGIEVAVRQTTVAPSDLPHSVLHHVIGTHERVLLDDASTDDLYSKDEYVRQKRSKSILCLPIVRQAKLAGALYLENNLTPGAFTTDRVTVLQLLASQAAISLENATLFSDLQKEEQNFRLIVDSVPGFLVTMTPRGEVEFGNRGILDYTGWTLDRLTDWRPLLHPDECEMVVTRWIHSIETGDPYDIEHRVLGADGVYRWFVVRGLPARDAEGRIVRWYILITNIDERKKIHEKLQRSEAFLAQGQQISQTGSFGWSVAGGELYWSEETYNIVECDRASKPTIDLIFQFVHPGDRDFVGQTLDDATREKTDFDIEHRLLMPDGRVKHVHIIGRAMKTGNLDFVGAVTDITAAKKAEEKIRQSEKEARQLLDLSPLHITELGPDGARLYTNRASLDYFGIALQEWQKAGLQQVLHPQDAGLVGNDLPARFQSGSPFEYEVRLKRKDGQYRWFHYRLSPMSDEQGRITRWYAAGTDIDDRKLAEQKLKEENVALREEVDKASMFEEIVGISASLKKVLSRISKVAPTDSSVLITGETGTGKELVARAIHRRSRRYSHTFVSVNCAAIPRDLIASELFGHEKGAFTGATQRRSGRFEMAEKGTIFLDEVGELPAETQIALLRVLQEREFERIGGSGSIRTDVRVIAATNRDLEAAIAGGTFRSDLYYRLNVFPIEIPTLRQRSEDIPLLVTYFLNRYARKAGKHFTAVDKQSLDLLQSYAWPGNIRELQNVIERSVVVSESQIFSVDESWLSRRPPSSNVAVQPGPFTRLPAEEKAVIEAALRECGGRVYGPSGAAARLGMPRTTLESKIRSLKIDKNRFRGPLKDN